jgi:hypothetical protein
MRERWRTWNRNKRGGLRGYQRCHRLADPRELAAEVVAMAAKASPDAEGVKVYRMPDGKFAYWMGSILPPKGAELLGVYDFEAEPEQILEDIAA